MPVQLQTAINKVSGSQLIVDGIIGKKTIAAIEKYTKQGRYYHFFVNKIEKTDNGYKVYSNDDFVEAGFVINCAGIYSDEIAAQLEEYGYLRKENGAYVPTIMVLDREEIKKRVKALDRKTFETLEERAEAARIKLKNLYRNIYQIVKADLPEVFANDTHQVNTAVECCYFHRGYIMQQALRMDYLQPACKVSKTIGARLYV